MHFIKKEDILLKVVYCFVFIFLAVIDSLIVFITVLIDRHLTYRLAIIYTIILSLVLALFPIYNFALTFHPFSSLPLDS